MHSQTQPPSAPLSPAASPVRVAPEPSDAVLREEAARYALLRRLTPTLRHHLVGEFQPIGMIAAMVDRRLQAEQPNLVSLRENSASLGKLSREAAHNCINIMTWIAPRGTGAVALHEGLQECLGLLSTEFRFKGLVIVNDVLGAKLESLANLAVSAKALRSVLPAALLALGDETLEAADLHVGAEPTSSGTVHVTLRRAPATRPLEKEGATEYRALGWSDVAALAQAESVDFAHLPDGVRLIFRGEAIAERIA